MPTITLPFNFTPRFYQRPILQALDSGAKRAVAVWHRRAGKEKTFVNYTAKKTLERVGSYYYFFPTYAQGKKAIWDGRDKEGFAFIDHFPHEYVVERNAAELKLTLANGSIFQIVGSDNIDAIMSTNPIGCVFAEYALQSPRAWQYIRPILRENGGWAIFDMTPRGKNHGYTIYQLAKKLQAEGDKDWFASLLTVKDTGVFSEADIEAEKREGMSEEMIRQEYYCEFQGVNQGAYFSREMAAADGAEQICEVPFMPELPVDAWWNFDESDSIAIWFTQDVGRSIHVIDYLESTGESLPWYIRQLQEKPYVYGTHTASYQIEMKEYGTTKTRYETAEALGIRFNIAPHLSLQDGVDAGRAFVSRCWFDRDKTELGRNALESFHKKWDEKKKSFSTLPEKDWAWHGAFAWVTLALGHKPPVRREIRAPQAPMMAGAAGGAWMGN